MENISYDDFKKLDMRIGWIRCVEPVEGADKLLRFEIDFGLKPSSEEDGSTDQASLDVGEAQESTEQDQTQAEPPFDKQEYAGRDVRQIVSGIREAFPQYEALVGKKALYVVNLEPRTIRGVESQGMLMAVDGLDGNPVFLTPEGTVHAGSQVR